MRSEVDNLVEVAKRSLPRSARAKSGLQLYAWEYQGTKGQSPIQADISYVINPVAPKTTTP